MALKQVQDINHVDIYYMNDVSERGGVVSINKEQQYKHMGIIIVSYNEDITCIPIGILLNDVVKIDLNKYTTPIYIDSVCKGSKVQICTDGIVVTNKIIGTPKINDQAILYPGGYTGPWLWGGSPSKKVKKYIIGKFLSKKDKHGYAQLLYKYNQ